MSQPTSETGAPPVFPGEFLWGASTAAYQIEGAATADGRGPSIWDTFCGDPGRIADGSSGEVACDHYHRYPEDVGLLADLGVGAYRFSIAWPRIHPDGGPAVNKAGLDFYERLTDALLAQGIRPVPTLFHWDLPQALEDQGGWLTRDTAQRFADYAGTIATALADRIDMWITLNEPVIHTLLGYGLGTHAPGRTLLFDALPTAHHQLLGHGLAVTALRAAGVRSVGIANNHTPVWAASDDPADVGAARGYDILHNRLFADPVLLGRYPEGSEQLLEHVPGDVTDDLATIGAPLDFYGLNYYSPSRIAAATPDSAMPFTRVPITEYPLTAFGWPVVPDGLREQLVSLHETYGAALPPVYITESGCAYDDAPDAHGAVDDPDRVRYLDAHVRAVEAARAGGVDVRGYFVWSLLDNFEWAEGYTKRFGLVYVDYPTQRRIPKTSYHWFRMLLQSVR